MSVIAASTGAPIGTFAIANTAQLFVADEGLGDGWILDVGSSHAYRMRLTAGQP